VSWVAAESVGAPVLPSPLRTGVKLPVASYQICDPAQVTLTVPCPIPAGTQARGGEKGQWGRGGREREEGGGEERLM
jgi:hypothetical protein